MHEFEEFEEFEELGEHEEFEEFEELGENEEFEEFEEFEEVGEHEEFEEFEVPFGEMTEQEFAAELMEITNEQEFEQFLGRVFKRAVRGVSNFARSKAGRALGGVLKSVARRALPVVGGALGNLVVPGVGGAIGSKLGSMAGRLFEFEFEGGEYEQEFEAARRFVRLAGSSARLAARAPRTAQPRTIAQRAVLTAAQRQVRSLGRRGPLVGAGRRFQTRRALRRPGRPGYGRPGRSYRGRRPGAIYSYAPAYAGGGGAGGGVAAVAAAADPGYGEPVDDTPVPGSRGTWARRGNTIVLYGV